MSFAHVDDPKGREKHPTYTGPGWCASGCGKDEGGIAGGPPLDFPSSNVQLLAWLPVTQFNAANTSGNTVEGYVSPAGREYAIIGLSHGTGFVDVTDPGSPSIVAFVPSSPTASSLWRDVRLYQTPTQAFCYDVSEAGGGIQVINMTNIDSGNVSVVGNFTAGGGTTATHTVFINQASGYLYRAGGGSATGLRIYNLQPNPASPTYVTTWPNKYVHEVTVVSYTSGPYAGKEIAFACGGDNNGYTNTGVYILDVTNKANIVQLSYFPYANSWFCHQGWPSPDNHYFYIDDELDDQNLGVYSLTRIVDISNLSAPTLAGSFSTGIHSIDHNLYTKDNFIYESNYRAGLRVFNATDPLHPTPVAFFDTWPQDDNAQFNGLWDNYPYLPSGTILGADIEKGLFVWRVGQALLSFQYPNGQPALLNPNGASVDVNINNGDGVLDPASAKLNYSINGGAYTQVPLQSLGGPSFRANFPALTCGSAVDWYISARTTTGITVRDPVSAPTSDYTAQAAVAITVGLNDEMETDTGWVVGAPGDTATTGIWVRADPVGTAAQPEDDHTPAPGVKCWITGNGAVGGGLGDADVDGGATTLTSPAMNALAGNEPRVVYHRWYSNNQGGNPVDDSMPVLISNNNGTTWVQLELVTDNAGAWVRKSFRIADFVAPTSQMKVRFVPSDFGGGNIVEAGVDDVRIEYTQCNITGDINGDGHVNVDDLLAVIVQWGACPAPPAACPADIDHNGTVDVNDLLLVITHWG